jgi:hypothetical protein
LLEIAVIDVGQHVLLFSAELAAPPGPLGFPALDLTAIDPDEAKISLLRPRRNTLAFGAIQFQRRLKRLSGADQQGHGDQTNQSNASYDSDTLHDFVSTIAVTGRAKAASSTGVDIFNFLLAFLHSAYPRFHCRVLGLHSQGFNRGVCWLEAR